MIKNMGSREAQGYEGPDAVKIYSLRRSRAAPILSKCGTCCHYFRWAFCIDTAMRQ